MRIDSRVGHDCLRGASRSSFDDQAAEDHARAPSAERRFSIDVPGRGNLELGILHLRADFTVILSRAAEVQLGRPSV